MILVAQMLIYSLGRTLQTTLGGARSDRGHLEAVLQSMVRPDPASRASLMDLLDVSTSYLHMTTPSLIAAVGLGGSKVALGQVFFQVLRCFPVNIIPPWLSMLICNVRDEQ
jgi:hypothetical protein